MINIVPKSIKKYRKYGGKNGTAKNSSSKIEGNKCQ